ncbi:hypothetical protein J6590_082304 [Homalodisca vitripennis]|nr:hypothetical protein J6590_082304 [Homalodisca vitripennis]
MRGQQWRLGHAPAPTHPILHPLSPPGPSPSQWEIVSYGRYVSHVDYNRSYQLHKVITALGTHKITRRPVAYQQELCPQA